MSQGETDLLWTRWDSVGLVLSSRDPPRVSCSVREGQFLLPCLMLRVLFLIVFTGPVISIARRVMLMAYQALITAGWNITAPSGGKTLNM